MKKNEIRTLFKLFDEITIALGSINIWQNELELTTTLNSLIILYWIRLNNETRKFYSKKTFKNQTLYQKYILLDFLIFQNKDKLIKYHNFMVEKKPIFNSDKYYGLESQKYLLTQYLNSYKTNYKRNLDQKKIGNYFFQSSNRVNILAKRDVIYATYYYAVTAFYDLKKS